MTGGVIPSAVEGSALTVIPSAVERFARRRTNQPTNQLTIYLTNSRKKRGAHTEPVCAPAPSAPGLTKRRQTPHAAATFGVLTELEGCRPPGPGTLAS